MYATLPYRDKNGFYYNPHVVILGAGASRAAFPMGDRNGKTLPLMADLISVLNLKDYLQSIGFHDLDNANFEEIYSKLFADGRKREIEYLNKVVYDYFDDMELPDSVTIYDELILSLREKDLIATFNWDPLLFKAYIRNLNAPGKRPYLAFLHGNVGLSVCYKDKLSDYKYHKRACHKCGSALQEAPLLYPVTQKDYLQNELIKTQWDILRDHLEKAYMVTIFGYGAPSTDVEAIKLFKDAWDSNKTRNLSTFTIIEHPDVDAGAVEKRWRAFSTKDNDNTVGVIKSCRDTRLWRYARRSCESLGEATLQQNPMRENPVPQMADLHQLHEWFAPLAKEEEKLLQQ